MAGENNVPGRTQIVLPYLCEPIAILRQKPPAQNRNAQPQMSQMPKLKQRFNAFRKIMLGFSVLAIFTACSGNNIEPSKKVWPFDYDRPEYVLFGITDYSKRGDPDNIPIFEFRVPSEFLRPLGSDALDQILAGEMVSARMYGRLYARGDEYLLPTEALDKFVNFELKVSVGGTDSEYSKRIKKSYSVDGVSSGRWLPSGNYEFGLEKLRFKHGPPLMDQAYSINTAPYGVQIVKCFARRLQEQEYDLEAGSCVLSFELEPRMIVRISFPYSQFENWQILQSDIVEILKGWKV